MSKEEASKLPSRSVVLALMKKSVATKEQTSKIAGELGERIKSQVENGNLDAGAFRVAAGVYRLAQNNEIRAKDRIAHIREYLRWIEEELHDKGHVGNLADMASEKKPSTAEAMAGVSETAPEPTDRLTSEQALSAFRKANEDAGVSEQPEPPAPAPEPVKAKPGRKPKLKIVEAAPEPPPSAPRLEDDDDWNGSAPTPPEPALAGAMH